MSGPCVCKASDWAGGGGGAAGGGGGGAPVFPSGRQGGLNSALGPIGGLECCGNERVSVCVCATPSDCQRVSNVCVRMSW
jgi:hypothetical protein